MQYELWKKLELSVYRGGTGADAVWDASAVSSGTAIDLSEHVKLKVEMQNSEATTFK